MKLVFLSFLLIISGCFTQLHAQLQPPDKSNDPGGILPTSTQDMPRETVLRISEFFKLMMQAEISTALQQLLKGSRIAEKKDQLKRLTEEVNRAMEMYGTIRGFEKVKSELVGESFLRARYIALHDALPTRWIFTWYKMPQKGWVIVNIKFDDEADLFFEDNN
jgi:hypothetical protein